MSEIQQTEDSNVVTLAGRDFWLEFRPTTATTLSREFKVDFRTIDTKGLDIDVMVDLCAALVVCLGIPGRSEQARAERETYYAALQDVRNRYGNVSRRYSNIISGVGCIQRSSREACRNWDTSGTLLARVSDWRASARSK